jgi:signal peptidase I
MSSRATQPRFAVPAWLDRISRALSFVLLVVFSLAAVVLIVIPVATGSQTFSVLTNSMTPSYPPGTFLVVRPADVHTLQVGDVVTYQVESNRPEVVTHRITGFTAGDDGERKLITRGDNNDVADREPVMAVQVRGKLLYAVPYVGFAATALGNTDRSAVITVLAVLMIGYGITTMVRGAVKDRRASRHHGQDEGPARLPLPPDPTDPGPIRTSHAVPSRDVHA